MPKGILQSMWIFSRFKPDVVLGVGGYSAAPAMAAAWMCGIKRAIHEQNAIPGITNRMLAGPANRVFVSIGSPSAPWCRGKGVFTGNPVRKRILIEAASVDRQGPFTILVLGGSQGAHRINEAVIASLKHLAKGTVRFIHQTGESDRSAVKAAYESHGIEARISAFFTDMGRQYGEADLIVSRAGATTVAEIAAIGKCALFIPYPFAADNHQEANAKMLVEAGAGEMILERSLGGDTLAETIARYAADSDLRNQMAENARRLGKPDAAERIVEEIRKLITDNR